MSDHNIQSDCRHHYPNRVLTKKDLAVEIRVCEKTVDNLVKAGKLPAPCWLNSKPRWMLYDIHTFISAQAGKPRTGDAEAKTIAKTTGSKTKQGTKGTAHKAGKFSV